MKTGRDFFEKSIRKTGGTLPAEEETVSGGRSRRQRVPARAGEPGGNRGNARLKFAESQEIDSDFYKAVCYNKRKFPDGAFARESAGLPEKAERGEPARRNRPVPGLGKSPPILLAGAGPIRRQAALNYRREGSS